MGANSCLYEMTPIYMAGNYENDRVASPESVTVYLKVFRYSIKFSKENTFYDFLDEKKSKMESTIKGKNLLLQSKFLPLI